MAFFECFHVNGESGLFCTDWKGELVNDGATYVPDALDPCHTCTCDGGYPTACHSVSCSPPNCVSLKPIKGECCKFTCEGDSHHDGEPGVFHNSTEGGVPIGSHPGEHASLSLRLVASTVTTLLILALLLFMVHRLRQRRILIMLRRSQQVDEDDQDGVAYVSEFNPVYLSCGPYNEPPPPYTPPKPAEVILPPPYQSRDGLDQGGDHTGQQVNGHVLNGHGGINPSENTEASHVVEHTEERAGSAGVESESVMNTSITAEPSTSVILAPRRRDTGHSRRCKHAKKKRHSVGNQTENRKSVAPIMSRSYTEHVPTNSNGYDSLERHTLPKNRCSSTEVHAGTDLEDLEPCLGEAPSTVSWDQPMPSTSNTHVVTSCMVFDVPNSRQSNTSHVVNEGGSEQAGDASKSHNKKETGSKEANAQCTCQPDAGLVTSDQAGDKINFQNEALENNCSSTRKSWLYNNSKKYKNRKDLARVDRDKDGDSKGRLLGDSVGNDAGNAQHNINLNSLDNVPENQIKLVKDGKPESAIKLELRNKNGMNLNFLTRADEQGTYRNVPPRSQTITDRNGATPHHNPDITHNQNQPRNPISLVNGVCVLPRNAFEGASGFDNALQIKYADIKKSTASKAGGAKKSAPKKSDSPPLHKNDRGLNVMTRGVVGNSRARDGNLRTRNGNTRSVAEERTYTPYGFLDNPNSIEATDVILRDKRSRLNAANARQSVSNSTPE